jgi:hypothetical protein
MRRRSIGTVTSMKRTRARRRILLRVGLVVALLSTIFLGAPTSASASGSVCSDTAYHACVFFDSLGEHFEVCDYAADGHSAVGVIELYYIWYRVYDVVWASGNGYCERRNYSIDENRYVRYHACVGERAENRVIWCGEWKYDRT